MKDMVNDKRRHQRKKMPAGVYYKDEKKQSFDGCIAKDVSESGVCIRLKEFFPIGTVLDLQFKLPLSLSAIYVKGKIRWINKMSYNEEWEAGLEIFMDKHYMELVQKYINSEN